MAAQVSRGCGSGQASTATGAGPGAGPARPPSGPTGPPAPGVAAGQAVDVVQVQVGGHLGQVLEGRHGDARRQVYQLLGRGQAPERGWTAARSRRAPGPGHAPAVPAGRTSHHWGRIGSPGRAASGSAIRASATFSCAHRGLARSKRRCPLLDGRVDDGLGEDLEQQHAARRLLTRQVGHLVCQLAGRGGVARQQQLDRERIRIGGVERPRPARPDRSSIVTAAWPRRRARPRSAGIGGPSIDLREVLPGLDAARLGGLGAHPLDVRRDARVADHLVEGLAARAQQQHLAQAPREARFSSSMRRSQVAAARCRSAASLAADSAIR